MSAMGRKQTLRTGGPQGRLNAPGATSSPWRGAQTHSGLATGAARPTGVDPSGGASPSTPWWTFPAPLAWCSWRSCSATNCRPSVDSQWASPARPPQAPAPHLSTTADVPKRERLERPHCALVSQVIGQSWTPTGTEWLASPTGAFEPPRLKQDNSPTLGKVLLSETFPFSRRKSIVLSGLTPPSHNRYPRSTWSSREGYRCREIVVFVAL